MPVLADPKTVAGPLTAADLDRATNRGRIYHPHRATVAQCPPCHGNCRQGRDCNADACAAEGGQHTDPVPSGSVLSMRRHRRTRATVALALALAAAGYAVRLAWPLLGG